MVSFKVEVQSYNPVTLTKTQKILTMVNTSCVNDAAVRFQEKHPSIHILQTHPNGKKKKKEDSEVNQNVHFKLHNIFLSVEACLFSIYLEFSSSQN